MLDIGPCKIFNNMHEHHFVAMNEFNEWMASYVWSRLQRDIHSCSAWSRQRHGCTHLAVGCNVKRSLYYMNGLFHTVRAVSLWSAWTASVFPSCDVTTSLLLEHTRFTRFWVLSNSLVFSSIGVINFIFWLVTESNWITVHSSRAYLCVLHASVCAICTTWLCKYNFAIFCQ